MMFLIDCWVKIVLCDVFILHVDIAMAISFVFRGQLNFKHNLHICFTSSSQLQLL